MAQGWPGCAQAVAAIALLVAANKLTFLGYAAELQSHQQVQRILEIIGHY